MDRDLKDRLIGMLLVVMATVCWSTSGIFIHWVVAGSKLTSVGLAFWRDLATFLVLWTGLRLIKPDLMRVHRRDLPWLAGMGALSIGTFHVLWNTVVLMIGVSVATVIQCAAPVFVTMMAWVLWREPLRPVKILAILLAAIGIALIAQLHDLSRTEISVLGVLIALTSAIAYGSFSLFGKKLTGSYHSWTVLLYVFGFATLALLPFQLGQGIPLPIEPGAALAFLGLVMLTTVGGFGLYTHALTRLPASIASITSNTEVPFAALLSYLLLQERLTAVQVLGAVLVVGGVVLITIPRRAPAGLRS